MSDKDSCQFLCISVFFLLYLLINIWNGLLFNGVIIHCLSPVVFWDFMEGRNILKIAYIEK